MIRNTSALIGLILAVVLQTSVLPVHLAGSFKPDLLLVAMVGAIVLVRKEKRVP